MPKTESSFPSGARLKEARERLLAGVAFDATWERDLDNDAVSWDENLEWIFGYPREDVLGELSWWRERVHPDDIAQVEQIANAAIRGDATGWAAEYRFRRKTARGPG